MIDAKEKVEKILSEFKEDIRSSVNRLCIDNILETPDYILAQYLYDCLTIFGMALASKDKHSGK